MWSTGRYKVRDCALRSIAAGVVGGLAGAFAMNQFQSAMSAISKGYYRSHSDDQPQQPVDEDATVKAAHAISCKVFDRELSDDEKRWAGPAVHYAMGGLTGGSYGLLATGTKVTFRTAALYGAAVWLLADEIAVPSLKLAPPPQETPASSHGKALASHLVFGLVTHATRSLLMGASTCL